MGHSHTHRHHSHDHGHHHHHHDHSHPHDHNHGPSEHLHSHVHGTSPSERIDELQSLASSFIDGFRDAADKTSYLRLAGVPFQRPGTDGLTQHLVDAQIVSNWQIGTASPAFASPELVYMPFPGSMVAHRETMTFTYVSMSERTDLDLTAILTERIDQGF